MNILGLSAFFHDSSAALVRDGAPLAAAAEERFTRQKHDPNFPRFAAEFCLKQAGMAAQDLDAVVFYEEPHTKFSRVLASSLAPFPFSRKAFSDSMKTWLSSKLWIKDEISRRLDIHPKKISFIPHHLSHAAQAFLPSPYDEAAILTLDAVGEWASTGLFHGKRGEGARPKIRQIESIPYPHSLGLAYSAMTAYLGFRPNDGECSVMALAAFGTPTYLDEMREIIRPQEDGTYEIDASFFRFNYFDDRPFSDRLVRLLGEPRSFKQALPFDSLPNGACSPREADRESMRFANIAASLQVALEEAALGLLRRLRSATGARNLCLAGGVALNCVANSRVIDESGFEGVFIPPDPGDGGAALGAALYAGATMSGGAPRFALTSYLGREYDEAKDEAMLAHLETEEWDAHRRFGCPPRPGMRLRAERFADFNHLISRVVDDLRAGRLVGWLQGRFESGPRALGNRSILADPGNAAAARRLSDGVKGRAAFRPYAISVAEEDAARALELRSPLPLPARWMQMTAPIRHEAAERLAAAGHADGTTRPQVCSREENPRFHALLTASGQATGLAALLNTSFNESGYPMVSSPAEALLVLAWTELDAVVLNNLIVRKEFP